MTNWLSDLDDEDIVFIKKFILASGSLKEIAKLYGVTYPTVRIRLDKLIDKIKLNDQHTSDDFITMIKKYAIEDKIEFDAAKAIIAAYKKGAK